MKRRDDAKTHRPIVHYPFSPSFFVLPKTPVQLTRFTRAQNDKTAQVNRGERRKRKEKLATSWRVWCSRKQENLEIHVKKQCREEANLRYDWSGELNRTELFVRSFCDLKFFVTWSRVFDMEAALEGNCSLRVVSGPSRYFSVMVYHILSWSSALLPRVKMDQEKMYYL